MKKQLGLRVEARLKDGLDERAQRAGVSVTAILEDYIEAGLARDNGELIEQNSLPAIRAAVREEVARSMQELYQQLSADLAKSARRSDDRLAALIVKAARSAGIAQRMMFSLASKLVSYEFSMKIWESAKEQTGKDIAKPADETKTGEQRN
jgi:outer membrane PBP1 activator LpoA protein